MELMKYDAACRAVAEAKSLDDVKEIKGICEAARAYAKIAKNRQMEMDAMEIRVRAERKEGELIFELKKVGIGIQGRNQKPEADQRVTLKELGITGNDSAIAQRLASLPDQKFELELNGWRSKAEDSSRFETPLQNYRLPTVRADRQRAAQRLGRRSINTNDPLDRFRTSDGRRIADWRWGELPRLEQLAERVLRSIAALYEARIVANPDPLSTMEMTFGDALAGLLEPIWDESLIPGESAFRQQARMRPVRQCERCSADFPERKLGGKARRGESNENRFCSRACAHAAARKNTSTCGTSAA